MRAKEFVTESTGQIIGPFKLISVNNGVITVEGHEPLKLSASVRDRLRSGYNYAFDIVNGEVAKVILMVVDAVIYTDTEVLLIKRKGEPYAGHWALPGGFVEPGESVADAAKRELQEETGLVVNNVQPVGEFKTPNRDPRMENTWSYAFKLHLKDRGKVHAGDDASAASWIPREQLSKLPLAFDHSAILAKALTLDEQVQPELTNGEGFEHTVDRNGITLKAASNGHGALQIKAFVQGKKAGEAYFEMTPDNQHIASDDTHVDQRFRRTGIATVMYQYAKELGNSIAPSPDRTPDGNAMWLGFMRKNSMIDEAPIRLSDSLGKSRAWIEQVYAKYPQTWQNNHVMPMGGQGDDQQFAMFELIPSISKKDSVEVKWFQAYPLRQGVGSRAMRILQDLARTDGIGLTLFPWQHGQVSQSNLTKFYKGQGFKPTLKGAKSMYWTPQ